MEQKRAEQDIVAKIGGHGPLSASQESIQSGAGAGSAERRLGDSKPNRTRAELYSSTRAKKRKRFTVAHPLLYGISGSSAQSRSCPCCLATMSHMRKRLRTVVSCLRW